VNWLLTNEGYLMSDGTEFANGSSPATAGQLLKAAREAQGLHIAALAVSLKVPVKKLELLEADRLDELPDAVFVRALASSMCRALKVDATEILSKLPQTHKPRLSHTEQSLNAPFRMPTDGPAPSMLTSLSRPAVLGVMALLLAALVLIFLPDMQQKSGDAASAALSGLKTGVASVSLGGDSSGTAMGAGSVLTNDGGVRPAAAGVGDAQTTVALSANGVQSVNATASTPTVASPTLVISTALSTATATADGIVVFRAKGETWVEVIDVNNKVTLRKLLAPGEAAGATGAVPLRVTVGRADQTSVTVRGKPFDGESLVRDNVLRFEVR
jgi:cytoskeleton protein RodZ